MFILGIKEKLKYRKWLYPLSWNRTYILLLRPLTIWRGPIFLLYPPTMITGINKLAAAWAGPAAPMWVKLWLRSWMQLCSALACTSFQFHTNYWAGPELATYQPSVRCRCLWLLASLQPTHQCQGTLAVGCSVTVIVKKLFLIFCSYSFIEIFPYIFFYIKLEQLI